MEVVEALAPVFHDIEAKNLVEIFSSILYVTILSSIILYLYVRLDNASF